MKVDRETELARRICAAVMSYQMGISMQMPIRRHLVKRMLLTILFPPLPALALDPDPRGRFQVPRALDRLPAGVINPIDGPDLESTVSEAKKGGEPGASE